MTDAIDEKLYGLLEMAERQQVEAQTVLQDLAAERAASIHDREQWAQAMDGVGDDLRAAVSEAVTEHVAGIAEAVGDAVREMNDPLAEIVAQIAEEGRLAEAALRGVVQWASGRLLLWTLGAIVGLGLLCWSASSTLLWWDTSAIGAAQMKKAQLQAEVAELTANRDAWAKAGMLDKLARCGPKKLPCVRIDDQAGAFGEQSDYRVVRGS